MPSISISLVSPKSDEARQMCTTALFPLLQIRIYVGVTPGGISHCQQDSLVLLLALLGDPEKILFLSALPFLFSHLSVFRVTQISPNTDG